MKALCIIAKSVECEVVVLRYCIQCHNPIVVESQSFEQRLIGDEDFCRKCWDYVVSEEDIPVTFETPAMPYLAV